MVSSIVRCGGADGETCSSTTTADCRIVLLLAFLGINNAWRTLIASDSLSHSIHNPTRTNFILNHTASHRLSASDRSFERSSPRPWKAYDLLSNGELRRRLDGGRVAVSLKKGPDLFSPEFIISLYFLRLVQ